MPPKIGSASPATSVVSSESTRPSEASTQGESARKRPPADDRLSSLGARQRPEGGSESVNKRPRIGHELLVQTHKRFYGDGPFVDGLNVFVERNAVVAAPDITSNGEPLGDAMTRALRGKKVAVGKGGELAASDAHMHPTQYQQTGRTLNEKFVADMDRNDTKYSTLMPIPTTAISTNPDALDNRHAAHHCGPAYYIPDTYAHVGLEDMNKEIMTSIVDSGVELYLDTGVDASLARKMKGSLTHLSRAQRERLDPMITGIHLGDAKAGDQLLRKLAENPGVFTGVGEVTLAKELVDQLFAGASQANVKENINAFKHLAEVAGVIGMPIVMHCDVDSLQNQLEHRSQAHDHAAPCTPANLDSVKSLLSDPRLKDTTMVWAHAGGLGRFVAESENHTKELQGMLDKHKNLMVDISWSQVATQLTKNPAAMDRWEQFLNKNHDRILFGSDALAPTDADKWNATRKIYTDLLDRLPLDKQANILNNNYERVFVDSREKVRNFEKKVLTPEFCDNVLGQPRSVVIHPDSLRAALVAKG